MDDKVQSPAVITGPLHKQITDYTLRGPCTVCYLCHLHFPFFHNSSVLSSQRNVFKIADLLLLSQQMNNMATASEGRCCQMCIVQVGFQHYSKEAKRDRDVLNKDAHFMISL